MPLPLAFRAANPGVNIRFLDGGSPEGGSEVAPRRRGVLWPAALLVALSLSMPVAVGFGPVPVPAHVVVDVAAHRLLGVGEVSWSAAQDNIIWLIRGPRVILGAVVGAALAVCGVAVQALVRNILADPYLLGISSGASAGAAASILFGVGSAAGGAALTGSAFVGALGAIIAVFAVARIGGRMVPSRLVFAGIAVGFALTALTNFLVFTADSRDGTRAVLFWSLGSLQQARWSSLPLATTATLATVAVLALWSRRLDAIAVGEDTARTLGTHPTRFRAVAVALVALCIASVVAVSGAIGFVGLVVPHLARRLVGAAHARVLPTSALLGALLLVWADVLARTAFQPRELPLGILTALIGTPLLILLVRRSSVT